MALTLFNLLATVFAVCFSASHKFLAEQNLICNTCKKVAVRINDESAEMEDALEVCKSKLTGESFTSLCAEILTLADDISSMHMEGTSANDICESLNYCDFEDEIDYASMPAYDEGVVDMINELATTWVAGKNEMFETATLQDVRKRLGTIVDSKYRYPIAREVKYSSEDYTSLPENFDVREGWPACAPVVGTVRDQSDCGSCWTFGSTDAFNDRYCIASIDGDNADNQLFSNEQVLGCCTEDNCGGSDGCDGGYPQAAWEYFVWNGVVSGGLYSDIGKNDTCLPYTLPPCWHHEYNPFMDKCPDDEYSTPQCYLNCTNTDYPTAYNKDKHHADNVYRIEGNCSDGCMENVMSDIYNYGPVSVAFLVYEDFEYYVSGVYQHTWGEELGGHSVKMMGWGVENGTKYWLVQNSWNQYWGDNGYFKILRGVNECDIESEIYAGRVGDDDDIYGFVLTKEEKLIYNLNDNVSIFKGYSGLLTDLGVCLAIGFLCAIIFMVFRKFDCKRKVERLYYNTFGEIEGEETHPLL